MDRESEQEQLEVLMDWVSQRIKHEGQVPWLSDVMEQAVKGFGYRHLKRTVIAHQLRLHPYYHMNFKQTRWQHCAGRYCPIVVNHLASCTPTLGYFQSPGILRHPPPFRRAF